jgi:hypothetical protein
VREVKQQASHQLLWTLQSLLLKMSAMHCEYASLSSNSVNLQEAKIVTFETNSRSLLRFNESI